MAQPRYHQALLGPPVPNHHLPPRPRFNLFALRSRNLQLALGNIIEGSDDQGFTASHILHAIRFLAHVNEDGRWTHPTHKSDVTYSMQRLPAVAGLPAGVGRPAHPNAEPKLIATQILNTDATH
jgi:hypothetical protein